MRFALLAVLAVAGCDFDGSSAQEERCASMYTVDGIIRDLDGFHACLGGELHVTPGDAGARD